MTINPSGRSTTWTAGALRAVTDSVAPGVAEGFEAQRPSFRLPALSLRLRSASIADCALAFAFSAFLTIQILHHALWRDELNAWGIVLASPSLADLFGHLHYEGHPGLWHLLLWIVSRVSTAPGAMQTLHAAIGFGVIWMVALASPFGRTEKALILLGYFLVFEYTVVSRNYGIGLLIALVYAHRRAAHPEEVKRNAALLGLLANTNLFALILSGAFALEYAVSLVRESGGTLRRRVAALMAPVAIYAVFSLLSIATLWPAKDISWRTTAEPVDGGLTLGRVVEVLVNNLSALIPIDQQAFWAPAEMIDWTAYGYERVIILAVLPALIAVFLRLFRPRPALLIIPSLTFMGSAVFNLAFYEGSVRHWGINFVAFLSALWILRASTGRSSAWAWPILGLSAIAGIVFTIQHWSIPFSNAGATAAWLENHGLEQAAIAGTPDTHVAAVAELLGRSAYFLDCRCTGAYLEFKNRRDDFTRTEVVRRLAEAPPPFAGQPSVYLDVHALSDAELTALADRGLALHELAFVSGALTENFHIYAVRRTGESPPLGGRLDGRNGSETNG